jgi:hypothetical protein
MASIKCGHCKKTHSSVAEVRACAAASRHPVGTSYGGTVAYGGGENLTTGPARVHERAQAENWGPELTAHLDDTLRAVERQWPDSQPTTTRANWIRVDVLRAQVRKHLHRIERGKRVGYFAVLTEDGVKFYRVRSPQAGKWAGKVFVDAQASDEFWPVRAANLLTKVLDGILADPEAAGKLYATELGRCCRCRRTLTDETSRAYGIGPECRKKAF